MTDTVRSLRFPTKTVLVANTIPTERGPAPTGMVAGVCPQPELSCGVAVQSVDHRHRVVVPVRDVNRVITRVNGERLGRGTNCHDWPGLIAARGVVPLQTAPLITETVSSP